MSQKITSKNLSYSSDLPPFLAALHAQAGNTTGPDPLLARQRRAVKKRSASEEAEDVPLVVDELGNAVAVDVEKDGTVKEKETAADAVTQEAEEVAEDAASKKAEGKAEFGARKRKAGKVIRDDDEQEPKQKTDEAVSKTDSKPEAPSTSDSKEKKPKKKAKKIKLSFDEED